MDRALGRRISDFLQITTGSSSDQLESSRTMERRLHGFLSIVLSTDAVLSCLIAPTLGLSTEADTVQQQWLRKPSLLLRPRTTYFSCARVWAVISVDLGRREEHTT